LSCRDVGPEKKVPSAYQEMLKGGLEPTGGSKINCSYDDGCITGGPGCQITNIQPLC
jgi:hypothetical protein